MMGGGGSVHGPSMAKALAASLVSFLVTAAFISVLYYPAFWYLIALIGIVDLLQKNAGRSSSAGVS